MTVVAVCAGRTRRVEVLGDSMQPTLQPGDRLLLLRTPRARPGQLVAVRDPRQPARTVIKRVVATSPAGVTVLGDNPKASTDSRIFGPVAWTALRGRAVYRYFPPDRRGLLRTGAVPWEPCCRTSSTGSWPATISAT